MFSSVERTNSRLDICSYKSASTNALFSIFQQGRKLLDQTAEIMSVLIKPSVLSTG